MTANTCPLGVTAERLERLLTGGLSDAEEAELLAHADQCPACIDKLAELYAKAPTWNMPGWPLPLETAERATESRRGPALEPDHMIGPRRIVKFLGEGGMGRVYLVRHVQILRLEALKSLSG